MFVVIPDVVWSLVFVAVVGVVCCVVALAFRLDCVNLRLTASLFSAWSA